MKANLGPSRRPRGNRIQALTFVGLLFTFAASGCVDDEARNLPPPKVDRFTQPAPPSVVAVRVVAEHPQGAPLQGIPVYSYYGYGMGYFEPTLTDAAGWAILPLFEGEYKNRPLTSGDKFRVVTGEHPEWTRETKEVQIDGMSSSDQRAGFPNVPNRTEIILPVYQKRLEVSVNATFRGSIGGSGEHVEASPVALHQVAAIDDQYHRRVVLLNASLTWENKLPKAADLYVGIGILDHPWSIYSRGNDNPQPLYQEGIFMEIVNGTFEEALSVQSGCKHNFPWEESVECTDVAVFAISKGPTLSAPDGIPIRFQVTAQFQGLGADYAGGTAWWQPP